MNFDWYSSVEAQGDVLQEIHRAELNCHAKIKLLSLLDNKKDAKNKHRDLLNNCYSQLLNDERKRLKNFNMYLPQYNIDELPQFSLFIQVSFILASPYMSRDDDIFYITENPIRKDKVFKLPLISGSSWKGNLRWTARQTLGLNPDKPDSPLIVRLFGNEKGQDSEYKRGRLNFYDTYFDGISLEIINPHDRNKKAGTAPIGIESVPVDGEGTFSLFYVPYDLIGHPDVEVKNNLSEDISCIQKAVREMLIKYGFSAKKSCGFGLIDSASIKGTFSIKDHSLPFLSFTSLKKVISAALKEVCNNAE